METHDLEQGSTAWLAHRAKHNNAGDAAAMLGLSPHKTRTELLHERHTGLKKEYSDFVQKRVLDEGHRVEALARPVAEEIVGEDLYPMVVTNGHLSASLDGATMLVHVLFEHKQLNNELREIMRPECVGTDLPLYHQVQMEHQLMTVEGAQRVLFMASSWTPDGELIEERHCWYHPNPALAARIAAGWKQFEEDLASYVPNITPVVEIKRKAISQLPALNIRLEGKVVSTNMKVFTDAARLFVESINTTLKTDQDFADAQQTIKFCQDGEDRLDLVKSQALAQTADIDAAFREIDAMKALLRDKRLDLNRTVEARKVELRTEIQNEHANLIREHVEKLNKRLGMAWLQVPNLAAIGEAMKGKRTVDTLREAASNVVTNSKIALNELADRLDANRKALTVDGIDYFFLFADFATVGAKASEDFTAVSTLRIQKHLAEEKAKQDKIAADAKAKQDALDVAAAAAAVAAAAAAPKPADPIGDALAGLPLVGTLQSTGPAGSGQLGGGAGIFAPGAERAGLAGGGSWPSPKSQPARPPILTSVICERLGFVLTVERIKALGISPAPTPKDAKGRNAIYWREEDFIPLLRALTIHIRDVALVHQL